MWSGWYNGGGKLRMFARDFSRKCAPNLRKINPKVPPQEAYSIAQNLYGMIKQHGPLTVSNTWLHAKEAGVAGLNSKTHLKIMLKWMRGRKLLKQFCQLVGSNKKFLLCTLPEEAPPQSVLRSLQIEKPPAVVKKKKIR
ncbi:hypothetical protein Nepgr_017804 [Nepenthes gracilis]|uniref:Uncharacterized protein n=1 Tax=Nepenthes gracilis TaxID=150966 RepID=A0AAD3SQ27_NEPGR|nr:hypothetical protein Nepgr_017804 [Nepenthes gracilis]